MEVLAVIVNTRRLLRVAVIIFGVLALDQISKQLVIDNIAAGDTRDPIPALADYFQLTHSANTGAAFGIFANAGDFFLVLAIIVVLAMLYYYPHLPENATITRLATGLVCGGALGNAIDRIHHGYVIDFIHYQIPGVISNVSNIADHAIVGGVILILIDSYLLERTERRDQEAESGAPDPPIIPPEASPK
jgi:signal peptidase II